jgi:hypothetical protein
MPGTEIEDDEMRARLQDCCDVHTLHHGRSATLAILEKTANVREVRAVPDAKISEVLETVRQDIAAAKERKAQRRRAGDI